MVGSGGGGGGFTFHLKGMMSGGVRRWRGSASPRGPSVNTRPFSEAVRRMPVSVPETSSAPAGIIALLMRSHMGNAPSPPPNGRRVHVLFVRPVAGGGGQL